VRPHSEDASESGSQPGEPREAETGFAFEAMKWNNAQRAYPASTIPHAWREKAANELAANKLAEGLKKSASVQQLTWTALGPNNIGGRVRSIAFDPLNSSTLYCGSVSGGVWKSTNSGASWNVMNDAAANLVIGSLAVDPTNGNTIYAATGEGYFNLDWLTGVGVLKSTDGGTNWVVQSNFATPNPNFGYSYINRIVIRPDQPNTVYAGMLGGIWKTTNGGTSWAKLNVGSVSVRCMDLVMHPTTYDIMYATFGNLSKDGIYKTTDGGSTWGKLTNGLPTAGYYRINMAISKSAPSTLYAAFDDSATHDTYNIYKSTNDGASWSVVTKPVNLPDGGSHLGTQGWYNNCIAVHPTDPNTVLIGGINLFKTTDGGASWNMKSEWYSPSAYPFVHADQHIIAYDPSNSSVVYFGNDGGMYKSTDGGETFSMINAGLGITQFYSGAIHPTLDIYYGGTQDNGTLKSGTLPAWTTVFGGDGGATAVDQTTPATVFTEYVYLNIQRSSNSGASFTKSTTGIPTNAGMYGWTTDRCLFIAPITMDPSNSQVLVAGTFKIYRTTNSGTLWSAISSDLTGDGDGSNQNGSPLSAISAIAIAKSSSATMYVGTSGGTATSKIQVTTNTGVSWTDVTTATLPDRYVKAIAIDPVSTSLAYAVFSGYNANTPTVPGHVFRTANRGTSWTNISGNLPDVPVNTILVDPVNTGDLLIGTDIGIFQSVDGGVTWIQQNSGLATVSVADLDYRASDGAVFAATHGRGMFKLQTLTGVTPPPGELPRETALAQNFPNPFNPTTSVKFTIATRSFATLKVYDIAGREIATLFEGNAEPGEHQASWNAANAPSGVYFARLTAGGVSESRKMILVK
jgi:photosystem II stability/assembly factor-like uncharacterized protein